MTQASQKIMQQYIDGGVIPAQLEGQAAVSKSYVDGRLTTMDADISKAVGVANSAQADIDTHEVSSSAHPAANITYSGKVTGVGNVKQAIDAVKTTLDQAMISGDSGPEALAARYSTLQNITYPSLKDRLDSTDELITETSISRVVDMMKKGQSVKVVCYGDSVTWGFKATNPGGGTQVAENYPAMLQQYLRNIYNNSNITVINEGHSGWKSSDALSNLSGVTAQSPDMVIVMFGINDVRSSSPVSISDYTKNMDKVARTLKLIGVEVVICTPTPILDTVNDNHIVLGEYAKAAREVAKTNNTYLIDLQDEFTDIFLKRGVFPVDMLPDAVHLGDNKYPFIAGAVINRLLKLDNTSLFVNVTERNEFSIPIYGSPMIKHNLTSAITNAAQTFKTAYTLSVADTGKFLRFDFYINAPGMSLVLRSAKSDTGGKIVVYDAGTSIGTVDFYAPATYLFDTETTLIKELSVGWHSILFDQTNITLGQSASGGACYLSEFIFRPLKTMKEDKLYGRYASVALPTLENFNRVINGKTRLKNSVANEQKGAMLLSGGSVNLVSGKTLVAEAYGTFLQGSGVSWLGNIHQNSTNNVVAGVNTGYLVYLDAGSIAIYSFGNNNALGAAIATASVSGLDFNQKHLIRIEHDSLGNIKIYLDGTLRINTTNTVNNNGFFGLYTAGVAGTIELEDLSYCYV